MIKYAVDGKTGCEKSPTGIHRMNDGIYCIWCLLPKWFDPGVYCGHGKKYKGEDCPACDKIWNEECLERAYKSVVRYSDKLGIPYPEIARNYKAAPINDASASPPQTTEVGLTLPASHKTSGPAVAGWMPIETFDGSPLDCVDVWMEIPASRFSFGWTDSFRVTECRRNLEGKWTHYVGSKEKELQKDFITHWMPLPSPPPAAMSENPVDLKPR